MGKFGDILVSLRGVFVFSASERRGVLVLLPLLAVAGLVLGLTGRPVVNRDLLTVADQNIAADGDATRNGRAEATDWLFEFDPNTVTFEELCSLGLDAKVSAGIIKYRARGKRFEIPEDLAACYGVTMEDYRRLAPYINIGDEFALVGNNNTDRNRYGNYQSPDRRNGRDGTQSNYLPKPFDPNLLDSEGFMALGFSGKQADVIIRYRESLGGFSSAGQFGDCYVVSEEKFAELAPFIEITTPPVETLPETTADAASASVEPIPVNLNTADSSALRSVRGIGEVLVVRILEYRERLGGFHDVRQLAEIQGMYEDNYERIVSQIFADSCEIRKIDINFAPHKLLLEELGKHPYMNDRTLRKILKQRQMKGGWSTIGEMVDDKILTIGEAERLAPYLLFRTQ